MTTATAPAKKSQELKLRPYQRETIDAVYRAWEEEHRNVLVVAATGAGKTVIFLQIVNEVLQHRPNARFLIIAHRKELIDQPAERMRQFWPDSADRVGIVMAETDEPQAQVVIATVQTLQSRRRIDGILAHGQIDYLIIDEAHHSSAAGYLSVIETLREANPEMLHLGVTATPVRADGNGLPYDVKAAHYGIKELVKSKFLAPPRWLAISTAIDIGQVAINYGGSSGADFNQTQLKSVFETEQCFELVAESHKKYADGRKALAFTTSVEGAYRLAEAFNNAGIPAAAADGTTDKKSRAEILKAFRRGEYDVLCNAALWTEGLDLPEVSCVHQVRPTRSDGLYLQMIGRALRLFPGKEDALILDYAPADARNVVMMGDVLGVDVNKEVYIEEDAEEGEVIAGFTFDGEIRWMEDSPMEIVSRQLDYLNLSPYRWQNTEKGGWSFLGLGPGRDNTDRTLAISPAGDTMELWGVAKREFEQWHKAYKLFEGTFEEVSAVADSYIEQWGNEVLAAKKRTWRNGLPSEGQLKYAKRLGINCIGMNRGDVADAITYKLAFNALKRAGVVEK